MERQEIEKRINEKLESFVIEGWPNAPCEYRDSVSGDRRALFVIGMPKVEGSKLHGIPSATLVVEYTGDYLGDGSPAIGSAGVDFYNHDHVSAEDVLEVIKALSATLGAVSIWFDD